MLKYLVMKIKIELDGKELTCEGPTLSKKELRLLEDGLSRNGALEDLADKLSALGHPSRVKIFAVLSVVTEICVCDIAQILKLTPSAASQHLAKMRSAKVVQTRKSAQTVYYSLVDSHLTDSLKHILFGSKEDVEVLHNASVQR